MTTNEVGGAPDAATRIRIDLAYDGSGFAGWAKQPGLRTVQGVVEHALHLVTGLGDAPTTVVAGRTDAGVHATGQVVHVDLTEAQRDALARVQRGGAVTGDALTDTARRRLRGALHRDADVGILAVREVSCDFDARFSALARQYRYRLADQSTPPQPLTRSYVASTPLALDERAMSDAADTLLGLRDFGGFCKPREGATTIRELQEFTWHRGREGVLEAVVRADAFCHSMVRSLVGACVEVGAGRMSLAELDALRDLAVRSGRAKLMPAKGLTLERVEYPNDAELAARAELTRARRSESDARTPRERDPQ